MAYDWATLECVAARTGWPMCWVSMRMQLRASRFPLWKRPKTCGPNVRAAVRRQIQYSTAICKLTGRFTDFVLFSLFVCLRDYLSLFVDFFIPFLETFIYLFTRFLTDPLSHFMQLLFSQALCLLLVLERYVWWSQITLDWNPLMFGH